MATLRNPRYERFAQELANGTNAVFAYIAAGFKPDRGNASRLQQRDIIKQRVGEILAQREADAAAARTKAVDEVAITEAQVLRGLLLIAETCGRKVEVTDDEGKVIGERIPAPAAANRAWELLGKHRGMFIERTMDVPNPNADVAEMTREQMLEEARRLAARITGTGGPRDLGGE